jgi:hypothetical protein
LAAAIAAATPHEDGGCVEIQPPTGTPSIGYPACVQTRWVIGGTFVVIGAYWLAMPLFFRLGITAAWWPYGVCALAAFGAGALMVAHAPLRPWREPAAAGVLAIAVVATLAMAGPGRATSWFVARALHPWYAGLGVAALSGAMAAAGGLAVRRIATATARTSLIVLLGALAINGFTCLAVLATYEEPAFLVLTFLAAVAAGGFLTQALIATKRPWACGAGGGVLVLFTLTRKDWGDGDIGLASQIFGALLNILVAYGGARLAWRLLRRGDAPSSPDVPSARLS